MDLNSALDKLKYDTRLIEWNLRTGIITREELEKHIAGLNDSQGSSMLVEIDSDDSDSLN